MRLGNARDEAQNHAVATKQEWSRLHAEHVVARDQLIEATRAGVAKEKVVQQQRELADNANVQMAQIRVRHDEAKDVATEARAAYAANVSEYLYRLQN